MSIMIVSSNFTNPKKSMNDIHSHSYSHDQSISCSNSFNIDT